jgi:hypothetical protein
MPYGTVNADVIQTSTSGGILGAGDASIMKNRIINGAMVINQRAGSPYTVNSASNYTLDRYEGALTGSGTFTVTQSTNVPSGSTFQYSALVTVATTASSYGTNDYYFLQQKIEGFNMWDLGWGTANAVPVTVSFWAKASITGTYAYHIINGSANYSYVATYTITTANTWQFITLNIPAPTSGTWAGATNGVGIYTGWDLGSGTGKQTTANTWTSGSSFYCGTSSSVQVMSTSGATLAVTGHQFEVGSSATGFEYRLYNQELSACQRYYEVLVYDTNGQAGMSAPFSTVSDSRFQWLFKVQKRANPSYSVVSGSWGGNTPSAYFSVSHIQFVTNGTYFFLTGSSGSTAISASAEL